MGRAIKSMAQAGLILMLVISCVFPALADENLSNEFYRAVDMTGGLSDAQRNTLDSACLEFAENWKADLSLAVITEERCNESGGIEATAKGYYEDCGFGYGPDKDGFSVIYDPDNDKEYIYPIGKAAELFDEKQLRLISRIAPDYEEEYGTFGPLYMTYRLMNNLLESQYGKQEQQEASEGTKDLAVPKAPETESEMIAKADEIEEEQQAAEEAKASEADTETDTETVPESGGAYEGIAYGHELYERIESCGENADPTRGATDPETEADETRKRVSDYADLLTDEEEEKLEAKLTAIRRECKLDLVFVSDNSSYGKDRSVYAADFYDYNGYGCGGDFNGSCLFICMEEGNRGFWTANTGSMDPKYTQELADKSDDVLYSYVTQKRFFDGVMSWADNMRRIYLYGHPFAYEWLQSDYPKDQRAHDYLAPRVVDDNGMLSEETVKHITTSMEEIAKAYDLDLVIHTAYESYEVDKKTFADRFYESHGYGMGEDYSGILITVFKPYGSSNDVVVTGYGRGEEILTDTAKDRLAWRLEGELDSDSTTKEEAFSKGLSWVKHLLQTGRVPRSGLSWFFSTAFELIVALIIAAIMRSHAKKKMDTPVKAENAEPYLVKGSLNVQYVKDKFLSTNTVRKYNPPSSSSSSSSSSGRSSYSRSYSGSSSRSHSGSGRSF
ncbi:MAG: TPM domain-containing protein [Lachnospiraceae bacterium]|nr:TPM domain-containing protein [Lachnospiraceae bacterium]